METRRLQHILKNNGYFITAPRQRLFEVLQQHPALTLKQLILLLPNHDQATVYRTVDLFEKLGIIHRIHLGWQTKIELGDAFQRHHHHFSCLHCGAVVDIPEDAIIEEQIRKLSAVAHFTAHDHQLEIRGLCVDCANLKPRVVTRGL